MSCLHMLRVSVLDLCCYAYLYNLLFSLLQVNFDWWHHHNRREAPEKCGVQYHSIIGRGFTASVLEGNEYVVYKNAQTYPG